MRPTCLTRLLKQGQMYTACGDSWLLRRCQQAHIEARGENVYHHLRIYDSSIDTFLIQFSAIEQTMVGNARSRDAFKFAE